MEKIITDNFRHFVIIYCLLQENSICHIFILKSDLTYSWANGNGKPIGGAFQSVTNDTVYTRTSTAGNVTAAQYFCQSIVKDDAQLIAKLIELAD